MRSPLRQPSSLCRREEEWNSQTIHVRSSPGSKVPRTRVPQFLQQFPAPETKEQDQVDRPTGQRVQDSWTHPRQRQSDEARPALELKRADKSSRIGNRGSSPATCRNDACSPRQTRGLDSRRNCPCWLCRSRRRRPKYDSHFSDMRIQSDYGPRLPRLRNDTWPTRSSSRRRVASIEPQHSSCRDACDIRRLVWLERNCSANRQAPTSFRIPAKHLDCNRTRSSGVLGSSKSPVGAV